MYDNENIFAKIIKGQIPCKKIYEDKDVLFFEDINPASEFYNQNIGPSFFDGQVSCYYFGKQGWGTCKARFGVINELYSDLLNAMWCYVILYNVRYYMLCII